MLTKVIVRRKDVGVWLNLAGAFGPLASTYVALRQRPHHRDRDPDV
jgi:hypothetical protein